MEPLRFIHTADLHLDSPFRGLSNAAPKLRDSLQDATLGALERVVDWTIQSRSDFLVVAGDLYDSKDRSLRALVSFRKQMERLAERDVPVFIVHGNHDPLNGWGSEFQLPANVVTFGPKPRTEPVLRRGREVARVTGVSYPRERVTENLAATMRPEAGAPSSVAVLHANIGQMSGHADYAPAGLGDLNAAGFDYWALGHVHTRTVLQDEPAAVVYPGNTQGRNPRETGPRGCFQVDVDAHGKPHFEYVDTGLVRWAHLQIPIQRHTRMESLLDAMLEKGRAAAAEFKGATITRCTLHGTGPLHRDLQREGVAEDLAGELEEVLRVESVRIATGPELDFASLAQTETLVSDFLKLADRALEDPVLRGKLADSLAPLFRRKDIVPFDDARLREWIQRAAALGVDLLLER
jgi:DNA repair exonuclease SbcCD nuclease subunit